MRNQIFMLGTALALVFTVSGADAQSAKQTREMTAAGCSVEREAGGAFWLCQPARTSAAASVEAWASTDGGDSMQASLGGGTAPGAGPGDAPPADSVGGGATPGDTGPADTTPTDTTPGDTTPGDTTPDAPAAGPGNSGGAGNSGNANNSQNAVGQGPGNNNNDDETVSEAPGNSGGAGNSGNASNSQNAVGQGGGQGQGGQGGGQGQGGKG